MLVWVPVWQEPHWLTPLAPSWLIAGGSVWLGPCWVVLLAPPWPSTLPVPSLPLVRLSSTSLLNFYVSWWSVWYPLHKGGVVSRCLVVVPWTLFSIVLCLFSLFWSLAPGHLAHYPFLLIPCSLCLLLLQYCLVMLCFSLPCVLYHSLLRFDLFLILFKIKQTALGSNLVFSWFPVTDCFCAPGSQMSQCLFGTEAVPWQ